MLGRCELWLRPQGGACRESEDWLCGWMLLLYDLVIGQLRVRWFLFLVCGACVSGSGLWLQCPRL